MQNEIVSLQNVAANWKLNLQIAESVRKLKTLPASVCQQELRRGWREFNEIRAA